jgi:LPXTG-site transpeptidase (sortase) family protein
MFESKYSNFLTALLIIIIIGILGLLSYVGYSFYKKYYLDRDAAAFVDSVIEEVDNSDNTDSEDANIEELENIGDTEVTSSSTKQYKGYNVVGTIEIPQTGVKYPILEKVSKGAIEVAVAVLYGPGPNQVGNTVIIGHNYRNGQFFSNNGKLEAGDKIYITDLNDNRVSYTIYDKFETTAEDTSFYTRNTNGAREITLSTCTNDSKARIIIEAKADDDE